MDVGSISTSTAATAVALKQLQAMREARMAVMKTIAESQQQMTELLNAVGIGQNIDVRV